MKLFTKAQRDKLIKNHLESLRCSIELIEEDIPYLNPNY